MLVSSEEPAAPTRYLLVIMVLFPQNLRNDEALFGDFRCLVECLFGCEEGFDNVLTHGGVDGVRVAHGFDAGRGNLLHCGHIGHNVVDLCGKAIEFFIC